MVTPRRGFYSVVAGPLPVNDSGQSREGSIHEKVPNRSDGGGRGRGVPRGGSGCYYYESNPANAPQGTHFKSGSATCSVSGTTVSCRGYTLAGVGNTDVTATLSSTYSATVVCINGGGNPSDSQHQGTFTSTPTTGPLQPKNGNVTVTPLSTTAPSEQQFLAQQTCPNPNWTPTLQGPITLQSFTYTVQFTGFPGPYITITGP